MKKRLTADKVWRQFSPFIKDVLENVYGNHCVSCPVHRRNRELIGVDRQLGHFRPKKAYPRVRWWIKNLGLQCSKCNGFLQGASPEFSNWIIKTFGQEDYDYLITISRESFNANQLTYYTILEGIAFYKKQIKDKKMTYKEVYDHIIETKFGLNF